MASPTPPAPVACATRTARIAARNSAIELRIEAICSLTAVTEAS